MKTLLIWAAVGGVVAYFMRSTVAKWPLYGTVNDLGISAGESNTASD